MAAYGDDAGFEAWLAANGYTLPDGAPAVAVLRSRGTAYLDGAYEALWTGVRADGAAQELGWPRIGARINCVTPVADSLIPPMVVNASYRAAYLDAVTPGSLNASATSGQRIAREKVDVIEVAYHNDSAARVGFTDSGIDGAMRAFICDQSGGFFLQAVGGC